ncbi:MAG: HEAT repeat domain-containing protein [Deltaproteobacteria bacterium]|nr:HEAT repeat domain-containing protein [Deltaproteobacteria bacterium]
MTSPRTWPWLLVALLALPACTRRELREREIRDEVETIAAREGPLAERAMEELRRFGRDAIPPIEAALPKAKPTGQLNLVMALRRLGDPAAIPLLRHLALRNETEAVRIEAEVTLRSWAKGTDTRAERARAALRSIEEARGRENAG